MPEQRSNNGDWRNIPEIHPPRGELIIRERIFEVAPLEQIFPLTPQQYHLLQISPDRQRSQDHQADMFQHSDTVVIDCNTKGLGDSVMEARHAVAVADKNPSKSFFIRMPEAMASLPFHYLPSNASFVHSIDRRVIQHPGTFFFNISSVSPTLSTQVVRWGMPQMSAHAQRAEQQGRVSNWTNSIYQYPKDLYAALGFDPHNSRYNLLDIYYAARAHALGVNLTSNDLKVPFLHFDNAYVAGVAQGIDLLIAPDAKELDEGKRQSRKSLSVDKWSEIFSTMDRSTIVGIVRGISHPDYTRQVLYAAQQQGLNASEVVTPTLHHFTDAVLSSRRFVGMDSGTTHVASEIVLAAKDSSRYIDIREIFTYSLIDIGEYAIRGLGDQGKMLEIAKPRRTPIRDPKLIPSQPVARFITA